MADKILDEVFGYLVKENGNGDPFTVSQNLEDSENPFIFMSKPDPISGRRRAAKIYVETHANQGNKCGVSFDIETHEEVSGNPMNLALLCSMQDYAVSSVMPEGKLSGSEYHILGSLGNFCVDAENTGCLAGIQEQIKDLFKVTEALYKDNEGYGR